MYKTSDFDYNLPQELIAQYPLPQRSQSRLLVVDRVNQTISHLQFPDLLNYLKPNDLMVFNNTKVIAARLFGHKESGGKVECLIERVLDERRALAHIRASKSPQVNSKIIFSASNNLYAIVQSRREALFELAFNSPIITLLDEVGEMPLPPYMQRPAEKSDLDRYQTVYAKVQGAVAAPTAGLHFDEAMLKQIENKKINTAQITLHVGAGTFQPVRVDDLAQHHMHSEWMTLSDEVCQKVKLAQRVIAVGTTSVRGLETAAQQRKIKPYTGETDIFIYPGYEFKCVNALLTNFHLPKSTLMMLVSAFGGYDLIRRAYYEAIQQRYRFYSYGDAMLII